MKKMAELSGNAKFPGLKKLFRIMKLTTFLILISVVCVFASKTYSQSKMLNLSMKNVSVKEVLSKIEDQSEFHFMYSAKVVDVNKEVAIDIVNAKIDDVLKSLFSGTDIDYTIKDRIIVLSTHGLVNNELFTGQQQKSVSGKVVDSTGGGLPGVSVVVKGTTTGTITDMDGKYTLNNVPANATLLFSFVGMKSQEIVVGGKTLIDVTLADETIGLEEVVAVGYGTQAKKDITGSVSVVKTVDLLAAPSASFTGQLQGRAAGLVIGSSGAPGSVNSIRIRGIGSVNDNSPLYVIDGVSTRDQDMSNINPNDIESIQVLKDASSASIYGAQAANGVIIITTKKGSGDGVVKLTYDGYYGIQKLGKGYDLLNSQEWMESEYKMISNGINLRGQTTVPTHPQFGTGTFRLPDYLIPTGAMEGAPGTTLADYNSTSNRITKTNKIGTNWFNEITQAAPIQNHQLSLTGGSNKGTYAIGLNYFSQEGTVKFSYYNRYSMRANTQFNLGKNIRIGENVTISFSEFNNRNSDAGEGGPIGRAMMVVPYIPVYDVAGNFAGNLATGSGATSNVYAEIYNARNNVNKSIRMLGNTFGEVDLVKDLTFRTSFGIDYNNLGSVIMSLKQPWSSTAGTTTLTESAYNNMRWVFSNTLTFKRKFNIHSLNALLGTESIKDGIGRTLTGSRQNFLFENDTNTWILNNGDNSTATNASNFNKEVKFLSFFGRIDYTLADKYMLTGTIRRDGSSRFAKENRYGYFPAVSLGWRMSEEDFMKNLTWVNNFKWRVGYGSTGNSEIPEPYNWASQYSSSVSDSYYDFANTQTASTAGYYMSTYSNFKTKWETSRMLNGGADISLFNYGLEVNFDLYVKKTSDMLTRASYSSLAGSTTAPFINIGSMVNKGFELSLTRRKTVSSDFSYEITGIYSMYRNEVTKLSANDNYVLYGSGGRLGNINRTMKGSPIGMFYGYKVLGFYDDESEVLNYKNSKGNTVLPYGVSSNANLHAKEWVGKYIYEDVNDDGKIDGNDMTTIGNPHPDFTASLNASIKYKNFDVSMYWYASVGNDIYRLFKQFTDYGILTGARSKDVLYDSWTPEHKNAKLPILDAQDVATIAGSTSAYIENGTFLKLKNLTIGYSLPSRLAKKAKLEKVRFYIQGANLLTITKYNGLDPEIGNQSTISSSGDLLKGIDGGFWPSARQFLFGVTLNM